MVQAAEPVACAVPFLDESVESGHMSVGPSALALLVRRSVCLYLDQLNIPVW